jgi:methyl-accepting chemotaxis protein
MFLNINNLKLKPKMIVFSFLFVLLAVSVGVFGIVQLNTNNDSFTTQWEYADSAMEIQIDTNAFRAAIHAYILEEWEAKEEYFVDKGHIAEEIATLKTILAEDDPNLIEIEADFNSLSKLIEGNQSKSELGLFSLVDLRYQTESLLYGDIGVIISVYDNSMAILDVIETNALANDTVDETVMNLELALTMGMQEIAHIHSQNSTVDVSTQVGHFLNAYNLTSDSVTNTFTQLESQIDGALVDASITVGSDLLYDQLSILLFSGNSSVVPWTSLILNQETGFINTKLVELSYIQQINLKMEELDIAIEELNGNLADNEVSANILMDKGMADSQSAVTVLLGFTLIMGAVVVGLGYLLANNISRPIVEVSKISQTIADGDLTKKIENKKRNDEIGVLNNSFLEMSTFLSDLISNMADNARTVATSSQEMASSAEEVNATSEEISSITQQMSRGAQDQTSKISASAQLAENLQISFNEKVKDIEALSNLIEEITGQVNMLALNASIEAARAGEYGRGFAVVAENIRQLAEEGKGSVSKVNDIIVDLRTSLETSIKTINSSIQDVASISEETASGAEEASAATEEQAATMQEMSSAAQELANIALDMENTIKKFRV